MSGVLGTADLAATTITDIYTVPVGILSSVNVNICNRNTTNVKIRLAVSSVSVTQANDEFMEFNAPIEGSGVLERTAMVIEAGKIITMHSDTANVSVVVTGIEEAV